MIRSGMVSINYSHGNYVHYESIQDYPNINYIIVQGLKTSPLWDFLLNEFACSGISVIQCSTGNSVT